MAQGPTRGPNTPPNTITQTTHALTIHVAGAGTIIGAVNEWNTEQQMAVTQVHEFGSITGPYGTVFGAPYEKVPGNLSSMTIRARRYDIFTSQMETAFGTRDLSMLSNDPGLTDGSTGHLNLREQWIVPANSPSRGYAMVYNGCWFSSIGRTLSSTGDRLINVNATIEYTSRERVAV